MIFLLNFLHVQMLKQESKLETYSETFTELVSLLQIFFFFWLFLLLIGLPARAAEQARQFPWGSGGPDPPKDMHRGGPKSRGPPNKNENVCYLSRILTK